jgi:hypothetical protein
MKLEKVVTDTATKSVKVAENLVKKAWSVLDAATEKEKASQFLSDAGIKAIQGKGQ